MAQRFMEDRQASRSTSPILTGINWSSQQNSRMPRLTSEKWSASAQPSGEQEPKLTSGVSDPESVMNWKEPDMFEPAVHGNKPLACGFRRSWSAVENRVKSIFSPPCGLPQRDS